MTTHVFAAGFGFLAFAVSLLIGMIVNNTYQTVVWRSLKVMVLFYILGCIVSAIGFKVIQENFEAEIEGTQAESESQTEETRSAGDQEEELVEISGPE
ncbi:MAG: hypothetical protein JEZ07_07660 [Phycisphaerae bacterium]|nr:hypothetical protein [Phycisphaerae bacterium]